MDGGYSVDSVGTDNGEESPADFLVFSFFNKTHSGDSAVIAREDFPDLLKEEVVYQIDKVKMSGEKSANKVH